MIEDDMLRRLKEMAARESTTLQALVNSLLRRALAKPPESEPYKIYIQGWQAQAQPGVDLLDRDKLFDLMSGR